MSNEEPGRKPTEEEALRAAARICAHVLQRLEREQTERQEGQ